jgi:flagellar basal body-associated protein FliL
MADKAEKKPDAAAAAPAAGGAAGAAAPAAGKDGHGAAAKGGGGIGGLLAKTPIMLGGVMILEAAVLFAGFKFLGGGPKPVGASVITEAPAEKGGEPAKDSHGNPIPAAGGAKSAKGKTAEVAVLDFKAQNKQTGRSFIYDVSVFVVVKSDAEQQVKDTITARKALITDRIRTIIAQNDPEKLGGGSEPGLETLRRQVKHQLDEIVGDGFVEEVLIPRCIPYRSDF